LGNVAIPQPVPEIAVKLNFQIIIKQVMIFSNCIMICFIPGPVHVV